MPRDGTHRIRTIDPDFWRHPKTLRLQDRDPIALVILLGIRSAAVDDAGRFRADEHYLKAEIMPLVADATPDRIRQCLETLQSLRLVHLYESDGERYGIVHDWWDWQRVDRPLPSMLPAPPIDLCRCCDPSHIRHALKGSHVSKAFRESVLAEDGRRRESDPGQLREEERSAPDDCEEPSGSDPGELRDDSGSDPQECQDRQDRRGQDRTGQEEGPCSRGARATRAPAGAREAGETPAPPTAADDPPQPPARTRRQARSRGSPPRGVCTWCASPTDSADESASAPQRLMQVYHDAYREQRGECPVPVEADWASLKRLLRGKEMSRLAAVIRHGVNSEDPLIVRNGHRLAVILSHYQGVAQALDRGETHGAHGAYRRPSGRSTPAPAESFGNGGPSEF